LRALDSNLIEITTPYLDRHNDFFQIYVKKGDNGSYILTDGGYTIDDLHISGCDLASPKRQEILRTTLNGFGVKCEPITKELYVETSSIDFSFKKHNLTQALLAVNDMFFMAQPVVTSLFIESVVSWLDTKDIRYTQNVIFTGKTGYSYTFDFVIPKSRNAPERIIKAMNNPNKENAKSFVMSWFDTKETRSADAKAYAILNDTEKEVSHNVSTALRNYGIIPMQWSEREKNHEVFTL
jgi:hypothetical protein